MREICSVQIVSLSGSPSQSSLDAAASFPLKLEGAAGAKLSGRPVVCGGYDTKARFDG